MIRVFWHYDKKKLEQNKIKKGKQTNETKLLIVQKAPKSSL